MPTPRPKRRTPSGVPCPWCPNRRTRPHRQGSGGETEYRCPGCGRTHTRKPGDPAAYAFFPDDIDRAFSGPTVTPLFPGREDPFGVVGEP